MADNNAAPKKATWFSKVIGWCLRLAFSLVIGLFISIIIEWAGMTFFYSDEGYNHAKDMYLTESAYLANTFTDSFVTSSPPQLMKHTRQRLYHYLVKSTSIEGYLLTLAKDPDLKKDLTRIPKPREQATLMEKVDYYATYWRVGYKHVFRDYLLSAVYIVQVYAIRLTILLLSIPLLITAIAYGASKGLNERSARRWAGGRESSTIFHWAKMLWTMLLVSPFIIYLALPFSVHPSIVIMPCAAALGIMTFMLASSYKKYI